jgi:hypothetical protein
MTDKKWKFRLDAADSCATFDPMALGGRSRTQKGGTPMNQITKQQRRFVRASGPSILFVMGAFGAGRDFFSTQEPPL